MIDNSESCGYQECAMWSAIASGGCNPENPDGPHVAMGSYRAPTFLWSDVDWPAGMYANNRDRADVLPVRSSRLLGD